MRIARTESFKKAWRQLTDEQKALARKAIENLLSDMRYPALRVKKIKEAGNIWEGRVSRSLRITSQIGGDILTLRNIGQHDETLWRP